MSSPCGCNDNTLDQTVNQVVPTGCPTIVHETVCVQAEVKIKPDVDIGPIQTFCVNAPKLEPCSGRPSPTGECTFTVSQLICVQVPVKLGAKVKAEPTGIVCGIPEFGNCSEVASCTFTIGRFKNDTELTNFLIGQAGGSIVLGIGNTGASFTVNTTNANDVLSFNTPTPPAPEDPPFAGQYQVLYAQLLAAKLNVINGATCEFATEAIAAADAFLAASPSGIGMAGAPEVQEPLALFNEGTAPGCPEHCP